MTGLCVSAVAVLIWPIRHLLLPGRQMNEQTTAGVGGAVGNSGNERWGGGRVEGQSK